MESMMNTLCILVCFPSVCLPAYHVHTCSFLSVVCHSYGFHVLTTFVVNERIYSGVQVMNEELPCLMHSRTVQVVSSEPL